MRTVNGTSTIVLAMFLVLLSSTSTSAGSIDDQIASLYKELRKVEVDLERSLRLTGLGADPWQKPDQQTIRLRDARSLLLRLNEIDFQASRIESKRKNKVQD